MPSKPTTRWQVSGYRFLVRRMEHALVRRDVRMLHDPMRSQTRALTVGIVLGLLVLAGSGLLALFKPQDKIGDSTILIGKDSGAVYVMVDDVVHPALNLASARLAAGKADKAGTVKESELASKPRGPLIGIPGAPGSLNFRDDGAGRPWTICDARTTADGSGAMETSVLSGDLELQDKASVMGADKALLVQGRDATYLVYNNQRARVNMKDPAVTHALGITKVPPRPISEGMLNSIPEVLPIVPPQIDGHRSDPSYEIDGHWIGDIVEVSGKGNQYVVLRDGLQAVSPLTAEVIRNRYVSSSANPVISPVVRTNAPESTALPIGKYPRTVPKIVKDSQTVSCLSWKPTATAEDEETGSGIRAELSVVTGSEMPIPDDAKLVPLAQADAAGPMVDSFYMKPGTGAFVQSTGIEPDSQRKDSMFYIADTGVRYGIKNAEAAKALGMDVKPESAPWPIVGLLAPGPSLSREAAMVAHDGVAPDPSPAKELVVSEQDRQQQQQAGG